MLHLNGGSINNLSQTSLIVIQKHFPNPVKEGHTFLFWCLYPDCDEKYDHKATDITKVTELYAHWTINNYTITFDYRNGTSTSTKLAYNEAIIYPTDVTREGFTRSMGGFLNQRGFLRATSHLLHSGKSFLLVPHLRAAAILLLLTPLVPIHSPLLPPPDQISLLLQVL